MKIDQSVDVRTPVEVAEESPITMTGVVLGFVIVTKVSVELTFVTVPVPPLPPVVTVAVVPVTDNVPSETIILLIGLPLGFPFSSVIHKGGLIP